MSSGRGDLGPVVPAVIERLLSEVTHFGAKLTIQPQEDAYCASLETATQSVDVVGRDLASVLLNLWTAWRPKGELLRARSPGVVGLPKQPQEQQARPLTPAELGCYHRPGDQTIGCSNPACPGRVATLGTVCSSREHIEDIDRPGHCLWCRHQIERIPGKGWRVVVPLGAEQLQREPR